MNTQAPPETALAWARLLKAHASVKRRFNQAFTADHGLTVTDFNVLLNLAHAEGGRMRRVDLAEQAELTPSGITRLLDRLEHSGYVEKDHCDTDARITYARLTEAGLTKLQEAEAAHDAVVQDVFEGRFTGAELATLNDLLARLPGAADAGADTCHT